MKRKLSLMTLSLMLLSPAVLAGGASGPAPAKAPAACRSISQLLSTDSQLSSLYAAVQTAGLVEELNKAKSITVFAPSDAAFAKVPSDQFAALFGDGERLADVLLYHVVEESATAADLRGAVSGTTVQGGDITISTSGNAVRVNGANVVRADIRACNGIIHVIDKVLMPPAGMAAPAPTPAAPKPAAAAPAPAPAASAPAAPAPAASAFDVTRIPALPLGSAAPSAPAATAPATPAPAPATTTEAPATTEPAAPGTDMAMGDTLYDMIVADDRFSTLRDLLSDAGLTETLMSGEFTVFAPTDDAFAALPEGALAAIGSDPEVLRSLLLYHVVPGRLSPEQIAAGNLTTAAGSTLTVSTDLGEPVMSSTGVIYPIGQVLMPEGFTVPEMSTEDAQSTDTAQSGDMAQMPELAASTAESLTAVLADPNYSTLRGLLERADLLGAFASGEYTVFAPSNDAFAALPEGVLDALTTEQLSTLLRYHVVQGRLTPEQLYGAEDIKTLQGGVLVLGNAEPQGVVTAGNVTVYPVNGLLFPGDFVFPDLQPVAPAGGTTGTTTSTTTTVTTTAPAPTAPAPAPAAPAAGAAATTTAATTTTSPQTVGTTTGGAIAGAPLAQAPAATGIAGVLADARFSTLLALLTKADLLGVLAAGDYTVFAPTNDAFAKVPQATLDRLNADPNLLKQVLLYHVVSGTPSLDAAGDNNLTTVEGSPLVATRAADGLRFGTMGATLDGGTAISAGRSNVYVIDTVLLPPALR